MINNILQYKKVIQLVCLLVVVAAMGFALINPNTYKIAHTYISMDSHNGMLWLNDSDVLNILQSKELLPGTEATGKELKPDAMEHALEQNPFVHKAQVYIDANNDVHISIKPTEAIVRVINMKGVSYYLSNTGQMLPLSANFTPRVLVATGAILNNGPGDNQNDTALLHTMFFVAKKICADTFLHALAEQLVIDNNNEWTLIPKWGKAHIMMGDTQNWDDKVVRLKAFYINKDKDAQWGHYALINLKYTGQVVCTRNDVAIIIPKPDITDGLNNTDSTGIVKAGAKKPPSASTDPDKKTNHPKDNTSIHASQSRKHPHIILKQNLNHKTAVHE